MRCLYSLLANYLNTQWANDGLLYVALQDLLWLSFHQICLSLSHTWISVSVCCLYSDMAHLTQVRGEKVSSLSSSAYHQCYYCLPQWGLVHPPQDGLQRPAHISCSPAQRDHLGRWRQCCRCEKYEHKLRTKQTSRLTDFYITLIIVISALIGGTSLKA